MPLAFKNTKLGTHKKSRLGSQPYYTFHPNFSHIIMTPVFFSHILKIEIHFTYHNFIFLKCTIQDFVLVYSQVVKLTPLSNFKIFSSFQRRNLIFLTMTPHPLTTPSPMQPLIYFLYLWIWTALYTTTTIYTVLSISVPLRSTVHNPSSLYTTPPGSLISLNHLKH